MAGFVRELVKNHSGERSSEWPKVRNAFVKKNPKCAVCGKKKSWKRSIQVHHIVPFSVDPSLELEESNLITLCGDHHLWVGHLGWFQAWNPNVVEDTKSMWLRIINRPTKDDQKKGWWNKLFEL